MAYTKTAEILTRIRELLQDGYGSVRTITSTRFQGGLHDGQDPNHQARLGVLTQLPAEASIVRTLPHPQRLVTTSSVQIELLEIAVKVVRTLAIDGQVTDSIRDAVQASAAEDASAIAQVLEWPPNLEQTNAGAATDAKGARYQGSDHRWSGNAGKAMRLESTHRFLLTALSRPATA